MTSPDRPNVGLDKVRAELRSVLDRIEAAFDEDNDKWTADKHLCLEQVEGRLSALYERVGGEVA